MGLFGNSKELKLGTCNLWRTTGKSGEHRRGTFFPGGERELERAVIVEEDLSEKAGDLSASGLYY